MPCQRARTPTMIEHLTVNCRTLDPGVRQPIWQRSTVGHELIPRGAQHHPQFRRTSGMSWQVSDSGQPRWRGGSFQWCGQWKIRTHTQCHSLPEVRRSENCASIFSSPPQMPSLTTFKYLQAAASICVASEEKNPRQPKRPDAHACTLHPHRSEPWYCTLSIL